MLTVDRVIAAPPAAVWDVLVDVEAWPAWGPSISGARVGAGDETISLGAVGHVTTPFGLELPFLITEFDPGRHWAWKVAGVSATSHRVQPAGDGCRLIFEVPWWAPPYLAVCALALHRIDKMVGR